MELFDDHVFFRAIRNNVIWAVLFITIPVCIGMLAAMLLLTRKRTRSIYQVAFLIPYVLAPSVNAMLWMNVIFSPVSGVISVFRNMGFDIGSPAGQHGDGDLRVRGGGYLALLELPDGHLPGGA